MIAYLLNLGVFFCVNAILAVTLNLIIGYAGIFTMAHAVFFGIGAYTAAFVAIHFTSSLIVVTLAAMLAGGALSFVVALPALRVRDEYFVAASLGVQMLGVTIFSEWKSFTGGLGGVLNIPLPTIFGYEISTPIEFFILALSGLALVVLISRSLARGSFGRNLMAVRDSESAALALGKNVAAIKTLAIVLSSSLAAIAGTIYAYYLSFINVQSFTVDTSVLIMAMVIIGGAGTIYGPIVGAATLMLLPSALSYLWFLPKTEIGSIQQIIYGLAMVLLMIYRPGGMVSSGTKSAR